MKPISAVAWVSENPISTVVAYGTYDKVQPFAASLRLKAALEENGVDYRYFELNNAWKEVLECIWRPPTAMFEHQNGHDALTNGRQSRRPYAAKGSLHE